MATYRQDMPPPGGYKAIDWTKVTRKRVNGLTLLGVLFASKGVALVWWYFVQKKRRLDRCEEFDSRIALMPFMKAETDRLLLKQCNKMRDAEREIMKDVPNWEVGKYAGRKVFNKEQHHFDSMLFLEMQAHMDAISPREYSRVKLGFNPRFGV